jgi:membrane associated rhomboid family serine protease
MGLYDRDYTRDNFGQQFRGAPQMRMGFGSITPYVKILLIINFAVFFLQILGADRMLVNLFSVYPASWQTSLQLWRLVTYQFLHSTTDVMHIIFNMIGLFFLGPTLERHWGSKRFLYFYLGCGIAGGLFYVLLASAGFLSVGPMIGASGAILGMLAACAILFPHIQVIFLFFPVPIRLAAAILIFIAIFRIFSGENAGGEAAHLGGMAAGAVYVLSGSWRGSFKTKFQSNRLQKQDEYKRKMQFELDRILKKVHKKGIHSLTSQEKRTLKKATRDKQMQDR